jgi:phosphinothricin acetyltransferase
MRIRDARPDDLPAVTAIYAHHVLHGTASFEEEPPDLDAMAARWRLVTERGLPWLVAEADGALLGYSYANLYRERSAYRHTVEDAVYVAPEAIRRGAGRALLAEVVDRCARDGRRQMVAVIGDSANAGSIGLHAALGFRHVGVLEKVGFKFGRWIDSVLMQRAL